MSNLNSILIEGNLVCDPLFRSKPRGTSVCTFSIASSRSYRGEHGLENEVSFVDVESRSTLAECCHRLGRKGGGVRVVGHLKQYRWIGSDGKQHSKIGIVADHVEFRTEPAKKDEEENPDYMNEYIQEETIPFDEIEKSRQQRAGK